MGRAAHQDQNGGDSGDLAYHWHMPLFRKLSRKGISPKPKKAKTKKLAAKVKPPALPDAQIGALESDILQLLAAANDQQVEARAQIGALLLEVKSSLPHGDWLPWLAAHMPVTPATAKRAIQLHHFRQSQPTTFAKLARLGLTKAYKLMTLPPDELEAFLSQAHWVASANASKTPLQMTFAELMDVLHPPKPETKKVKTTRAFRSLRRASNLLERALKSLWQLTPALPKRRALTAALRTLDEEMDRLGQQLAAKSLIAPNTA
jgi:hypothetical protein